MPGLIAEVEANDAITVKTGTLVTHTEGMPGKFTVKTQNGSGEDWDVFGAIVVATGWRPYDTAKLEYLGFGSNEDIITDIQFEELAANGGIKRKSDGKAPEIAAFIITSDADIMPYSSGVSSAVAIKQAQMLIEADPDAMAYVIYEELRAHGTTEDFYP